ncbi:hypothetical protein AB0I51_37440 [Streptomyces sp. NPDC050549]|uniref:hypothetical protein n=1 Tax=Streptomyces sp. NPDC050549 TaxID=3155406 RepID=UPI003413C968
MSPVHRAVRPALLLLAGALLLGACGIPTTGVVGSGEPGTGVRSTVTLYFTGKGGLVAVPRRIPQRPGVEAAVRLLFQGPTRPELSRGVGSLLRKLKKDPTVRADGAEVSIELRFDDPADFPGTVKPLFGNALAQVVCTAAGALHAEDPHVASVEVVIKATVGGAKSRWSAEGRDARCPA